LEEAMDENVTTSLRKASRHWNIPHTSLSYHLYGKIRFRKLGPRGVLIVEEDQVVIAWVLSMQKVGLLLAYNGLK